VILNNLGVPNRSCPVCRCNDQTKPTFGHHRSECVLLLRSCHVCNGRGNHLFVWRVAFNLEIGPCNRHAGHTSYVLVGACFNCLFRHGVWALAYFLLGFLGGVYSAYVGLNSPFLAGGRYSRLGPSVSRCRPGRAGRVVPAQQGRSFCTPRPLNPAPRLSGCLCGPAGRSVISVNFRNSSIQPCDEELISDR